MLALLVVIVLLFVFWPTIQAYAMWGWQKIIPESFCGCTPVREKPYVVTNPFIAPWNAARCYDHYPAFTHATTPDHAATTE
jgi:hypothetical protein